MILNLGYCSNYDRYLRLKGNNRNIYSKHSFKIIFAGGQEENLFGQTRSCLFLPQIPTRRVVGGTPRVNWKTWTVTRVNTQYTMYCNLLYIWFYIFDIFLTQCCNLLYIIWFYISLTPIMIIMSSPHSHGWREALLRRQLRRAEGANQQGAGCKVNLP